MTIQATKDAAYSAVATAPSPATSGTTLVVTAGEGARFPDPATAGAFYVTIWAAGANPLWAAGGATAGNFEIALCTARTTDTLTLTRAQEGTTARTVVVGDQIAETVTAQTLRNLQNLTRSPRSSNTILGINDGGNAICATAAYTQTLTAAATLGAGWWCLIKNDTSDGTTVLVVDPNGAETVDGLTTMTMYSGETRILMCNGSNFTTILIDGGFAKFTPTGGSFIVPAGIEEIDVVCIGSGGQGGGGYSSPGSISVSGGAGGGGGAVSRAILRASDFSAGATVTVTVGAGGASAGAAGAPGTPGTDGAVTSFGTFLKAGGGGGGQAGQNAASATGGGGGSTANSATGTTAGTPSSATAIGGQAGTGTTTTGPSSEWGGAGGAGCSTAANASGGSSIFGGPGGGSGGRASASGNNGAAGGNTQSYAAGGGGGAGTGGASPTKGTDGTFTGPYCGSAGGGGGAGNTGVAGKNGGAGSIGAGGGGGGSSANGTGATGGAGGPGECRVFYS